MTLLLKVVAFLEARGVASALIGGFALAAHGVARATLDADLLVVDRSVLDGRYWRDWTGPGSVEIRCGDLDDPLAGVVRWTDGMEAVDIVVGKEPWQARALERRERIAIESNELPIVACADLVLLKLFAGGPQDLLDVRLLIEAHPGRLAEEVERRLTACPPVLRASWRKIREPSE